MLLLPLLLLAVGGYAVYALVRHRHPRPATAVWAVPNAAPAARTSPWPTTTSGWLALVAFALDFVPMVLVNVVAVPLLSAALLLATVALAGVARFVEHDRSPTVMIVLVISALYLLFGLLFLAGEVFIGHD